MYDHEQMKLDTRFVLRWMVTLVPAVLPLYLVRFHVGPLPTTFLEVYALGLCVLATWVDSGVWGKGWNQVRAFRWPMLAWGTVSLCAVAWSVAPIAGLGLWRAYILEPLVLFVLLAGLVDTKQKLHELRAVFFMAASVLSIWGIIQRVTGYGYLVPTSVIEGFTHRAMGPFLYPNALALFIGPIGVWALSEWLKQVRNWFPCVTWVLSCLGVIVAVSQGGMLAVGATSFALFAGDKRFRLWAWSLAVVGLVGVLAIPRLGAMLYHQLTFQGWSGQVRLYMWKDTVHMLHDHWFTGAGFGGYPTLFRNYQSTRGIEIFQYPHTILLNLWTEVGALGVLVFGWVVATWIRVARSWRDWMPLLAILLHGLVDVPYFKNDLAMLFWVLALIPLLAHRHELSYEKIH